jgi:hypothetical protein
MQRSSPTRPGRGFGPTLQAVIEYLRTSQLRAQEQQQQQHPLAAPSGMDFGMAGAAGSGDPSMTAPSHARLMCFLSGPSDFGLGKSFAMPTSKIAGPQQAQQQQGHPPTAPVVTSAPGPAAMEAPGQQTASADAAGQQSGSSSGSEPAQGSGTQQGGAPSETLTSAGDGSRSAAASLLSAPAPETLLYSSKSKLFYEQAAVAAAAMGACVDIFAGEGHAGSG